MESSLELLGQKFPSIEEMAGEIATMGFSANLQTDLIVAAAIIHHFKMEQDRFLNGVMNSQAVLHPGRVAA